MRKVKYSGNFLEYIDTLENLNLKVGIAGLAWREVILEGLPHDLRKELSKFRGGEPEEDDALIAAIKEIGLSHERFLASEKARGSSGGVTAPGRKDKKRKRGENSDAQDKESAPAEKSSSLGKALRLRATRQGRPLGSLRTRWRTP